MSERDSVQKIYGIAAVLGMVESGNREDALHQLVYGLPHAQHRSNAIDLLYANLKVPPFSR